MNPKILLLSLVVTGGATLYFFLPGKVGRVNGFSQGEGIQRSEERTRVEERLKALEEQMTQLLARLPQKGALSLPEPGTGEPIPRVRQRLKQLDRKVAEMESKIPAEATSGREETLAVLGAQVKEEVKEQVDEAVEKKAAEFRKKMNKEPTLDTFAEVLELSDEQRRVVENEVRKGQGAMREIMEVPLPDGTNFVDELVDIMAESVARPGQKSDRWGQWIGRLMFEKVPGTNETYGQRLEEVKNSVRSAFRETMSEEQYREFVEWEMDPTDIEEIEDSPWADIETRVQERAEAMKALGK
ncbi:MAG: hypothetical protein QF752_07190 [Planctomycetota bacterium]|jgi:hypothetical protein|nr:hypothetical protein [Planctomycetota bacterium]